MHASEKQVGYRSQCKLPVQKSHDILVNGMYEPKTNHFHPIEHFLIHDPKLEEIRKEILRILNEEGYDAYNQRSQKGLRYIVLRVIDGKAQCTLITGKNISLLSSLIES